MIDDRSLALDFSTYTSSVYMNLVLYTQVHRYAILFIFIHRYLRAPPLIVHRPVRTSFFQRFHVPLVGASVTMREGFL